MNHTLHHNTTRTTIVISSILHESVCDTRIAWETMCDYTVRNIVEDTTYVCTIIIIGIETFVFVLITRITDVR